LLGHGTASSRYRMQRASRRRNRIARDLMKSVVSSWRSLRSVTFFVRRVLRLWRYSKNGVQDKCRKCLQSARRRCGQALVGILASRADHGGVADCRLLLLDQHDRRPPLRSSSPLLSLLPSAYLAAISTCAMCTRVASAAYVTSGTQVCAHTSVAARRA